MATRLDISDGTLYEDDSAKWFRSPNYNFDFRKTDGYFERYEANQEDDPQWSNFPEIADIEISKNGCPKIGGKNCRYCYKSNTSATPENMSLDTFKVILSKLGKTLTQVAFGVTGCRTNPDFLAMMKHCRAEGVIPNFTTSGADLDDEFLNQLPGLVGAVAVSYHGGAELCFKTVERLCSVGIKQVNIHAVTDDCQRILELLAKISGRMEDSDTFKLNALVLLSLKPKGRAKKLKNINEDEFRYVVRVARQMGIPLGFDSCSAHRAMKVFEPKFHTMIEPCESGLFSSYIDAGGFFHPCSFAENEWGDGLDVVHCNDFTEDVWMNPRVVEWREKLIAGGRECPLFREKFNCTCKCDVCNKGVHCGIGFPEDGKPAVCEKGNQEGEQDG